MGYRRNIKESTRRMLYARSGNMCAMYGCNNVLINENTSNISEICHIEAVNDDGVRYNDNLTDEEVNSYDNLVLLCPRCHAIVDNKANESIYTVEYLKEMKRIHEQQIYDALMAQTVISPPVHVETYNVDRIVTYFNNVYEKNIDASYVHKIIKQIYSLTLCKSAYNYSAYWNPSPTHTMPNTILAAGFKVVSVDLVSKSLLLQKIIETSGKLSNL